MFEDTNAVEATNADAYEQHMKLHCFRYQCTARSKTFEYQIGQAPDHL